MDVLEAKSLKVDNIVEILNRLVRQRGAPKFLFADKDTEFTGHLVYLWAYHHNVRIDFSRPGKPTDNAFIETFNGSLRNKCLNLHLFDNLVEAKRLIEAWRIDYNVSHPHMGIGNIPPREYALQIWLLEQNAGSDVVRNLQRNCTIFPKRFNWTKPKLQ
jgi:putative transposase